MIQADLPYEDQQIGQLYELMQTIRKQDLEENDPEYKPEQ
jgi:N-acetyl-anhydromuramyl-L-alanine amidase AmpD